MNKKEFSRFLRILFNLITRGELTQKEFVDNVEYSVNQMINRWMWRAFMLGLVCGLFIYKLFDALSQ
jgi:hypothetical protein